MKKVYLMMLCSLLIANYTNGQSWAEAAKLVAIDKETDDNHGYSVSISGEYAIVGAYHEDDSATITLSNAGAAYIYRYDPTSKKWLHEAKLHPNDRQLMQQFGNAVGISGTYAVVGAVQDSASKGAVYVYERVAGTWTLVNKLQAPTRQSSDRFGTSVAISGDTIIVGAPHEDEDAGEADTKQNAGSAYIYTRVSGSWTFFQKIVALDRDVNDEFGTSVAIDGGNAIIGAYRHDGDTALKEKGAAYVFAFGPGSGIWSQQKKLQASDRTTGDRFGWSVAVSGNYYIVGAPYQNTDSAGGNAKLNTGAVYLYDGLNMWAEQKVVSSDRADQDNYGTSVAISDINALVGSPYQNFGPLGETPPVLRSDAGAAYTLRRRSSGEWYQTSKLVVKDTDRFAGDKFGFSVAMDTKNIFIGAVEDNFDSSAPSPSAGAAYLFSDTTKPIFISNIAQQNVTVYPNPASDYVNLDLGKVHSAVTIVVYDVYGSVVAKNNFTNKQKVSLDIADLASGVYIIDVHFNSASIGKTRVVKY